MSPVSFAEHMSITVAPTEPLAASLRICALQSTIIDAKDCARQSSRWCRPMCLRPVNDGLPASKRRACVLAAWRYREVQKGFIHRRSRRHIARFILVALYTGTRPAQSVARPFSRSWAMSGSILIVACSIAALRDAGRRKSVSRRSLPPEQLGASSPLEKARATLRCGVVWRAG